MATEERVKAHIAGTFKPNKEQEPLVRIAEALEFIAAKLHDISFDVEEAQDGMHRIADNVG
jgi:hypothetical protein